MKSKTDWARFQSGAGSVKPTREHPEADVRHIVRGLVRKGLKPLPAKASISLRVNQYVLDWFKAQGAGYQTRINTFLREKHQRQAPCTGLALSGTFSRARAWRSAESPS